MKNLKHIKLFEQFELNEGGGAGIDFQITNVNFSASFEVTKGNVKLEKHETILPDSFNALGYDDGMRDVSTDMLSIDDSNLKKLNWDAIKTQKIIGRDSNYEILSELAESVGVELSEEDADKIKTFEDLFNILPTLKLELYFNYDLDYNTMHFAGYTRGGFEAGEILAVAQGSIGYYNDTSINGHFIETLDIIDTFPGYMPMIQTTEKFVNFYNDVFVNNDDEDDEDGNDFLKDEYGA
jgi:acyl carrier protein